MCVCSARARVLESCDGDLWLLVMAEPTDQPTNSTPSPSPPRRENKTDSVGEYARWLAAWYEYMRMIVQIAHVSEPFSSTKTICIVGSKYSIACHTPAQSWWRNERRGGNS